MKKISFFHKIRSWASAHKIASAIIAIIVISGVYYAFAAGNSSSSSTYTLSPASLGTIRQTVTGSGQVAAQNQIDITSEVSGTVLSVNVSVGQKVSTGQLIATLDSRDAAIELESARIAMEKLTQAAEPGELAAAQNALTKSYSDGFSSISDAYVDLPEVMDGLDDLFYSRDGYLSDQQIISLSAAAKGYRKIAASAYDSAKARYDRLLIEYKSLSRSSASSTIDSFIGETSKLLTMVSETLKNSQSAITFLTVNEPTYLSNDAPTAASNVSSWLSTINSSLTALLSAKNSIQSSANSLQDLIDGTDALDIRSQQLSLQQKIRSYEKYFIRAPFDGVIGKISVDPYDKASSGTSIATIVGEQKVSTISLNEVDAAKVRTGQPVEISFDAIDGLIATGTVMQVDQIGTVSSGVVSYGIKISISTPDERIKPGMSMNITITTEEKDGILVIPSSAIKTKNGRSYVEVVNGSRTASSTSMRSRPITASSDQVTPQQIFIETGSSDDSSTEIVSGLTIGDMVVIKTTTGTSGTTTTAPSILNSLTPQRTRTTTTTNSSSNRTTTSGSSGSTVPSGPPPSF